MQCPSCNNEVIPGEAFCDECGAALENLAPAQPTPPPSDPPQQPSASAVAPPAEPAVSPPSPAPGPAAAKLIINGTTFDLAPSQLTVVGREDPIDGIYPDIDLTPHDQDVGVSRRHAELHEQGGQWYLKDLGSTNYTVVNRQRAQPEQEVLLQNGDEIRFGRVVAAFQIG